MYLGHAASNNQLVALELYFTSSTGKGRLFLIESNKHWSEQCVPWKFSNAFLQFSHFGFSKPC